MAKYAILKVKLDSLEKMGIYDATTPQTAVNNMAKRGNLVGGEWSARYLAIPYKYFNKTYKAIVK